MEIGKDERLIVSDRS